MHDFDFIAQKAATAYLFPGQGSQAVGMVRQLVNNFPVARMTLEEADDTLGFALSSLCMDGPEEALTDTINAQPAILAASVAVLRVLASELSAMSAAPRPDRVFVAGHSMGEYSALVAAGSLAYADGLLLVRERGRLMKEAGEKSPGLMAAVLGLDESVVAEICASVAADGAVVQVANDNCPGQVVISGERGGMETVMPLLSEAGARKVTPLAVSIAAHSPLMAPAAEELRAAIEATPLAKPSVPVIGNTSAQPLTETGEIRAELVAQLTGSVRWTASMQRALTDGAQSFVEIGPGDVLTKLMRRIDRECHRQAVNDPESVQALVAWISTA